MTIVTNPTPSVSLIENGKHPLGNFCSRIFEKPTVYTGCWPFPVSTPFELTDTHNTTIKLDVDNSPDNILGILILREKLRWWWMSTELQSQREIYIYILQLQIRNLLRQLTTHNELCGNRRRGTIPLIRTTIRISSNAYFYWSYDLEL